MFTSRWLSLSKSFGSMLKRWYFLLFALLIATGCTQRDTASHDAHHSSVEDDAFTGLQVGTMAPSYTGKTPAGDTVTIGPDQPLTLLNLWATWCAPCLEEFPDIEKMHQELGPKGLRILAVNVDELDLNAIQAFADNLEVTFPVALDEAGDIQDRYQAVGLPMSFLINSDGTLAQIWTGRLPENAMDDVAAFLDT